MYEFTVHCSPWTTVWQAEKLFEFFVHICVCLGIYLLVRLNGTSEFYFYHSSVILSQIILISLQISVRANWLVFKPNEMKYDVYVQCNKWKESVHLLPSLQSILTSTGYFICCFFHCLLFCTNPIIWK